MHGTTKKRPDSVFLLEKAHLKPVSPLKSKEISFDASITAKIGKDNTIRFKGLCQAFLGHPILLLD